MRKYISICMLYVRSSIFKILLLFSFLAIGQFYSFHSQMIQIIASRESFQISYATILEDSRISILFLASILFLTIILSLNLWSGKGKSTYTIHRLSLKSQTVFLIQAIYNSCCFCLLIAFELFLLLLCYRHFGSYAPSFVHSSQDLFVSFYVNDFLHSLLPLEEFPRVIRNIAFIFALGFGCAYQSFSFRRKKPAIVLFVLCMIHLLTFVSPLGSLPYDISVTVISFYSIYYILYMVYRQEVSYEL